MFVKYLSEKVYYAFENNATYTRFHFTTIDKLKMSITMNMAIYFNNFNIS